MGHLAHNKLSLNEVVPTRQMARKSINAKQAAINDIVHYATSQSIKFKDLTPSYEESRAGLSDRTIFS